MSKALGLIETRGLVAAIEAADAMVKTANVTIVGHEITSPALITIKIKGDVAAVKAAVDAGATAAARVGEVVSVHVIPSPDEQLFSILPEIITKQKKQTIHQDEIPEQAATSFSLPVIPNAIDIPEKVEIIEPEEIKPGHLKPRREKLPRKEKEKDVAKEEDSNTTTSFSLGSLFDVKNDTISRLRKEALGSSEPRKLEITLPVNNFPDNLDTLNVHQLRHLARGIDTFPIKGREISKANRQELLNLFKGL